MTLVEMLIVVAIIGIFSGILIKAYIQVSKISLRIAQEKTVTQELLFVWEVLQNFADRNTLNYTKYIKDWQDSNRLIENNGMTSILYLSWLDWEISIYSTGVDCVSVWEPFPKIEEDTPNCWIELQKSWTRIKLTNPNNTYVNNIVFKIIPFAHQDNYYNDPELCQTNFIACINHPGVWVLGTISTANYAKIWTNNIAIPLQYFFNLQ